MIFNIFIVTVLAVFGFILFKGFEKISLIKEDIKKQIKILNKKDNRNDMARVQYISKSGYKLKRNHETDSGMDISSAEDCVIPARGRKLVSTGIHAIIPKGHDITVRPRSGLAVKSGIHTLAGVVDEQYTGEIKVCLANLSDENLEIKSGDRIAQLVLRKVSQTQPKELTEETFEILKRTKERGSKGFGSSDVNPFNKEA